MMFIWVLVSIALVAFLVAGVLWFATRIRNDSGATDRGDRAALRELERRYARGEVEREVFLTMRADLLEHH